jgi:hypothetical protein
MRQYTVHVRRHGLDPDRDLVLVKEGFSWAAFLLPLPFALWHRLWPTALAVTGAYLALAGLEWVLAADPVSAGAATAGLSAIVGFVANDARRRSLDRRGFAFAGVVAGETVDAAFRRFLDGAPGLAAEIADGLRPRRAAEERGPP